MSGSKLALLLLGFVAAALVASQFVMGMLILRGGSLAIRKAHQHSGYLTAAVAMIYIAWSMARIAAIPPRSRT